MEDPGTGEHLVEPDLATLNARLGLLASLAGFVFAVPAVIILKVGGAPSVIWVSIAVFAAAAVAGARLPVPRRLASRLADRHVGRSASAGPLAAPDFDPEWAGDEEDLAAFRPIADTEVTEGKGELPVMRWVRLFYWLVIPLTIGLMLLHNGGDWVRKLIELRFSVRQDRLGDRNFSEHGGFRICSLSGCSMP